MRVAVVNCDNNKCFAVDLDNKKVKQVNIDDIVKVDEQYARVRNTKATVLYKDKDDKFYGILTIIKSNIYFFWIPKVCTNKIIDELYFNPIIIDIDANSYNIHESNILKDFGKAIRYNFKYTTSIPFHRCSKETFIKYIESDDITETDNEDINNTLDKNDITETDNEDIEIVNCNSNEEDKKALDNNNEVLNTLINNIENKLENIAIREQTLNKKELELSDKSKRLNSILAKLESVDINNVNIALLNVKDIYENEINTEYKLNTNFILFENSIKIMQAGNILSVSKEYYASLTAYLLKNIEINKDCTKYKSIVQIKFDKNSDLSVIAVVDFDDAVDYVNLTVLKPFGANKVKNDDIAKAMLEYHIWRRNTIFS